MARSPTRPIRLRTRAEFTVHVLQVLLVALVSLALFLGSGMVGYHEIVGLGWIDSLLNASMILTGMGPVNPMPDNPSKIFASLYAIFSGAAFPALAAVVLYPFVHRMMVVLHLQAIDRMKDGDES